MRIITNLPLEDLQWKGLRVEVSPIADWRTALCKGLSVLNLPFGERHFPVVMMTLRPAQAELVLRSIPSPITADCTRSMDAELLIFPIAVRGAVVLTTRANTLPTWMPADYLLAGTLRNLPRDFEYDPPRRYLGKKCEPASPQPTPDQEAAYRTEAGSDLCVDRDASGAPLLGKWREIYASLYESRHADGPRRRPELNWDPFGGPRPNKVQNWADIDYGIAKSPIRVYAVAGDARPGPNGLKEHFCFSSTYFKEWRHRPDTEYFLRTFCEWRSGREFTAQKEFDFSYPAEAVIFTSIRNYVVDLQTRQRTRSLFPHIPGKGAASNPSEARKLWARALSDRPLLMGETLWVLMDGRALRHPSVRRFFEEVRAAPMKNNYSGSFTFFSDLPHIN